MLCSFCVPDPKYCSAFIEHILCTLKDKIIPILCTLCSDDMEEGHDF